MRKAGEEEDWKKKTRDRGGCKRLSDEAVKKVAGSTSTLTKGNEEERERSFFTVVCMDFFPESSTVIMFQFVSHCISFLLNSLTAI